MFLSCQDCHGAGILRNTDENERSYTVACRICGGDGVVYVPETPIEVYQ